MNLIETHAHIYAKEFDEDRDKCIERALQNGVSKILMPNVDLESIERLHKTALQYPDLCIPMMGIHPCSISETYETELKEAYTHLTKKTFDYCAIGEIGMDLYWDKSHIIEQQKAFETQIDWALEFNLPIVIHSRDATKEVLNIIEKKQNGLLKGVFHCFGGSIEEAKRINDNGLHIGLGGVSTFKNSGLKDVIPLLNFDTVVLETDCPYLAPIPFRGKRNEVSYIKNICEYISEILECDESKVAEITTRNAKELFKINE